MNKQRDLFRKTFVIIFIIFFVFTCINPSSGIKNNNLKILETDKNVSNEISLSGILIYNGSLLGYVNDTAGNPIEGALVRVNFHETYEEDYSDSIGFYHVTNIPICYCMKNTTCSKEGYKTEWVLLSIAENTTYDFVLTSGNNPPIKPEKPSGPIKIKQGLAYTFTAVTTDPEYDKISYLFDWGDATTSGWTQYIPSGTKASESHVFNQNSPGIRVKAKDVYGDESEWSDYLMFDHPRSSNFKLPFSRFLEKSLEMTL
ncbi:MAG: hypothetical protein AYK22_03990 [Thermoplasmatales archaeon SG8-52-3]|nr:MAG: hypothetical protein AYK22_03990 [Thermoplasmatales archaeon SG8-52-3]